MEIKNDMIWYVSSKYFFLSFFLSFTISFNHLQIFFMVLSLTHNIWGIYKSKVGYENCIEQKQNKNSANSEK